MRGLERKQLAAIALGTIVVPSAALACSGPGAMEVIEAAERRGWILFGVAAAIVVVFSALVPRIRRRSWRQLDVVLVLVVHPGLWMSARMGDCGHLLRDASLVMTVLTPLLCGLIYGRAVVRDRRRADPTRV